MAALFFLLLASCRLGPPKFDDVLNEYVFVSLSFRPTLATQAGYHRHAGVPLDELLDDVSQAALGRRRAFYDAFARGLTKTDPKRLQEEDRRDYELIQQLILRDRATLDRFGDDPAIYLQILERGLTGPLAFDYGPKELRGFHLTRRMELIPPLVNHAIRNLKSRTADPVSLAGIETLLGRAEAEIGPELKPKFLMARDNARTALRALEEAIGKLPMKAVTPSPSIPSVPVPSESSLARKILRTYLTVSGS